MSLFRSCACARHGSHAEHELALAEERVVEEAVLRAVFREPALRRRYRTFSAASEMFERLSHLLEPIRPVPDPDRGPAKYVRSRRDALLRVGFITGTTDTFCDGCDRLRVSANGTLRPCLATEEGLSGADAATAGDPASVARAVHEAWKLKPDGRQWRGCTEPSAQTVSMRAIGG